MISIKRLAKYGLAPALAGLMVASFVAIATRPTGQTEASSHREAPLISGDPKADGTDTYVFIAPDSPDKVTFVGNWIPLEEPAGGPNFYAFADDAIYDFAIDNNGDGEEDVTYNFKFETEVVDATTFLAATGPITSLSDPHYNVRQFYNIYRHTGPGEDIGTLIASHLPVPPNNIGPVSTPNYDALATAAINTLPNGGKVFAGQRDDPFFVDLGGVFDLATIRQLPGNAGNGIDNVAGFNTHSIVLQVPISDVTACHCDPGTPNVLAARKHEPSQTAESTRTRGSRTPQVSRTPEPTHTPEATPTEAAPNAIIGVWTDTYRKKVRVLKDDGDVTQFGEKVKVSRLGAPLVNEVVIPLAKKDAFNASNPVDDAQFGGFVLNSDLAGKINAVYNGIVNPIPTTGRTDLATVFLTGIPGLNQPPNVKPAEELRINLAIKPASCGAVKRLGAIAGDNCGFPNGRRLADDSTDVELRAVACGYGFALGPCPASNAPNSLLGDGVDGNDKAFLTSFPYVASPWSGFTSPHNTTPVAPIASGVGAAAAVIALFVVGSQIVARLRRRRHGSELV